MIDYTIKHDAGKIMLTILYSLCMIDNQISKPEEERLKAIATDLLNISEIPRTHLVGVELTNAIASLSSNIEKQVLIGLILDLAKADNKKNINANETKNWIQHVCTITDPPTYTRNKINQILKSMSASWEI